MADRTLTINHADGGSETYTINRDKFAGVRTMTRKIGVQEADPENITGFTISGSNDFVDGTWAVNGAIGGKPIFEKGADGSMYWNTGTSEWLIRWDGDTYYSSSEDTDYPWEVTTWTVVDGSGSPTFSSFVGGSIVDTETTDSVSVDHTAVPKEQSKETTFGGTQSITVNRDIDPLLKDVVGGAAAAYSLHDLNDVLGNATKVVRVRRESDNDERDFTSRELFNGTLESWVNVGKDYVGYAYFTDSSTANVDLSSSFTLEASKSWSIKFEYIGGDAINIGLFGNSAFGNGGFWFANQNTMGLTDDTNTYQALSFGAGLALNVGENYEVEFFNTPSEGVRVAINGTTMVTTPKVYGDITIDRVGLSRGRNGNRVIHNVRVDLNGDGTLDYSYAGDGNQASNWEDRVGSNDGTPTAQISTYNNEFTNGFVETWYDQSGNDNDAVQTVAANQPKIVDAGSLVRDSRGHAAINFDDVDDTMNLTNDLAADSAYTAFAYHEFNAPTMILKGSANLPRIRVEAETRYDVGSYDPPTVETLDFTVPSTQGLLTVEFDASFNVSVYANGTESSSGTKQFTIAEKPFTILGSETANGPADGKIMELIYYESDQSANRAAIEANINNRYNIY